MPDDPTARFVVSEPGTYHLANGQQPHHARDCTDACRTVGAPYVAVPGEIVTVELDAWPVAVEAPPGRARRSGEAAAPGLSRESADAVWLAAGGGRD